MKKVLAAVDNSLAARPVIAAAQALAEALAAEVEAVHVQSNGDRTAHDTAAAAEVPIHIASGGVVRRLVAWGEADDVVAMTIGARGRPTGRALGGTAAAIATAVRKPVLIVPPDARVPTTFRRVLVPLEGSASSTPAATSVFVLGPDAAVDVVALHVLDEESIPSFTDQPQHEHRAWTREFLARYCPSRLGTVELETRIGRADEVVAAVAEECGCDVIALGWSQELVAGRAPVVRATLQRSRLPVLLVPVEPASDAAPSTRAASPAAIGTIGI